MKGGFSGKLRTRTITAASAVIIYFEDGQVLEFAGVDDAKGFLQFYARNPVAREQNPGKIYRLEGGTWIEVENAG